MILAILFWIFLILITFNFIVGFIQGWKGEERKDLKNNFGYALARFLKGDYW